MKVSQLQKAFELARQGTREVLISNDERRRYQAIADLIWSACGSREPDKLGANDWARIKARLEES